MSSKFLLVGAATAPPIITTGLVQHIDFGDSSSYNDTNNQSSYNSNRILVNDLSGNNHTMQAGMGSIYGVNYTSSGSSGWATVQSGNGGHLLQGGTGAAPTATLSGDYFIMYNNTSPFTGLGSGDYTFEFWFNYYRENGRDEYIKILQDSSDYDYGWFFQLHQGYLRYRAGNSGSQVVETTQLAPNYGYSGWKHVVISKIGTGSNNCKIYHNATNTTTFTYNGQSNQGTYSKNAWGEPGSTSTSSSTIWAGMSMFHDSTYRYTGKWAILRRYSGKGLTASEVQNNFDADKARFGL